MKYDEWRLKYVLNQWYEKGDYVKMCADMHTLTHTSNEWMKLMNVKGGLYGGHTVSRDELSRPFLLFPKD